MNRLLFSRMDNSPLVLFRMFFGLLISLESFGAILTGWVRRTLIEPEFTFTFIGFEWLQPLPGMGMYVYFALMGSLGIAVMLGYRYRFAMIAFTLMWTAVYLMQKTAYNNHYYLLILISGIMCCLPAARACSLDAQREPERVSHSMYTWVKWVVVLQLLIVFSFAAIAKLYADWLDFSIIAQLMEGRADYPLIGDLLQQPWVHRVIGFFGVVFDISVIPLLLWKPTRKWAFIASIFFHLFNSIVFQIGIFPYLSLAFTVFFFEPETIRRRFLPSKPPAVAEPYALPGHAGAFKGILALYFLIQLALPLRHHWIEGDVLWTEEGHRMSWRMMLRSRQGILQYRVVDRKTGESEIVNLTEFLTPRQRQRAMAYPDYIWQFARHLKHHYSEKGADVSVYVTGRVRVNRREYHPFVDPQTDLAAEPWRPFRHSPWLLPSPYKD